MKKNNLLVIKNKKYKKLYELNYGSIVSFVPYAMNKNVYVFSLQPGFFTTYYYGTMNNTNKIGRENVEVVRKLEGSTINFSFFSPVVYYFSTI
jgi:hypothetical protein